MRRLVDVCYGITAVITAPIWLPRMLRTGKHRTDWRGRLGRHAPIPRTPDVQRVLIHAVSVGEVNAVRLLIDELTDANRSADSAPPIEIVLAVTTDTGFARAQSLFGDRLRIVRYPLDFSSAVERFLNAVQPDVVILVELEVWPNFVGSCARRNIPVCVVNGRLTARSHRRYRMIGSLVRKTFQRLSLVAAQTEEYAARFRNLGTPPERVHITGTMKWDTAEIADHVNSAETLAREMGIDRSKPLIVAGSTAPGEHELLQQAVPQDAQLLCAPRKPEWFNQASNALPNCIRRSATFSREAKRSASRQALPSPFLLDTIGELRQAYALADIVVIGRTFTDLGGSDMMEPIALGKPTIVGPHVTNFQDTVDALLKAGGLIQTDAANLARILHELLHDPDKRKELAERGRKVIASNQGATERTANLIRQRLQTQVQAKKTAVPA